MYPNCGVSAPSNLGPESSCSVSASSTLNSVRIRPASLYNVKLNYLSLIGDHLVTSGAPDTRSIPAGVFELLNPIRLGYCFHLPVLEPALMTSRSGFRHLLHEIGPM